MYGGHITDAWDRRTNNVYLEVCVLRNTALRMFHRSWFQLYNHAKAPEMKALTSSMFMFRSDCRPSELFYYQVLFNAGLFSAMELGPGFKAPDPHAHDFQVGSLSLS